MEKVLLVIPAYNEGKSIEKVVNYLEQDFPELDYAVVNDRSRDHTVETYRKNGYNLLDLPVNLGLAGCSQAGMKCVYQRGYRYAIQLDGDGQHRSEYAASMKEKLDQGYDIVIGSKFLTAKKDWSMRMVGSRLIAAVIRLTTGARIMDPTSGMRLFDRKMVEEFALNLNYGPELDTVSFLIKQDAQVAEVPVTIDERLEGESYLRPFIAVHCMTHMLLSILFIQNLKERRTGMKNLTRHLLYKGTDTGQQNVFWNIAESFVYAFASMVLSSLVIRVMGDNQGGIFSSGFSTPGQQVLTVAYFGIRPFRITDDKGEHFFEEYLGCQNATCILTLVMGAVYLTYRHGAGEYSAGKCMILILLVICKVIDGYADVYESEFQCQGSLYLTGKPNSFRTILSVPSFLIVLVSLEHLLLVCLVAVMAQMLGVTLFNLDVIRAIGIVDWNKREKQNLRVLGSTVFLFVATFLNFYVFSVARYAVDARMNNAASEYSSLIFMSTSVIYMVANLVIRSFLTKLTDMWNGYGSDYFKSELKRIAAVIDGLTVLATGATAMLGKWVLPAMEMLLGGQHTGILVPYYGAFVVIVLGGGFYALANPMYYLPVTTRRQRAIFVVYLLAAVLAVALLGTLVSGFGINGAAGCYLLLIVGLMLGFGLHMAGAYQKEKKGYACNGGRED